MASEDPGISPTQGSCPCALETDSSTALCCFFTQNEAIDICSINLFEKFKGKYEHQVF